MRVWYLILLLLVFFTNKSHAQRANDINQNFCNTLMFVVGHVSSDFELLRGQKRIIAGSDDIHYISTGKVTGVEQGEIVYESARQHGGANEYSGATIYRIEWRYEGTIYKGSMEKFADYYREYESSLEQCLRNNHDYIRSEHTSSDLTLPGYPDVIYRYKNAAVMIKLQAKQLSKDVYALMVIISK